MATVTNKSNTTTIKLNAGVDSKGDTILRSVTYPKTVINPDVDELVQIADDYEPLGEYNIYQIENKVVDYISV